MTAPLTSSQVSAEGSGNHASHIPPIAFTVYTPAKGLVIADTGGYIQSCRLVGHSGGGT
jgi:hypothetical protein